MGTPEFAKTALQIILDQNICDVVAVYTQPPRPKGRGQHVQKSDVHELAEQYSIPVFTPVSFKKDPNSIEGRTLRERQEKYRLKQLAEAQAKLKKDPNDRIAKRDVDYFSKQFPESSYVYMAESYIREYTESLARAEKKLTALKAEVRKSAEEIGGRAGENIMPVYLSMQNPLILDQRGAPYRIMSYRDTIIKAKQDGHDGVIIKNTYDGKQQPGWIQRLIAKWRKEDVPSDTIYIAFEPTQIKSAIGNIGTYDPTNPNIRYSVRGGIDENTRRAVQAIQDKTPAKYKEPEKKKGQRKPNFWALCRVFLRFKKNIKCDLNGYYFFNHLKQR
jgi:hypothetical protein